MKFAVNDKSKVFIDSQGINFRNSYDGDFLWKAEFTYKHKNQSSNE